MYDANPCNHVLQVVPTISLVSTIMGQVYLCDQVHTSCTVYMVVFALVIHIESKSKCCVGVTQHQLKTKPLLSTYGKIPGLKCSSLSHWLLRIDKI